jgi:hypothetical protein
MDTHTYTDVKTHPKCTDTYTDVKTHPKWTQNDTVEKQFVKLRTRIKMFEKT